MTCKQTLLVAVTHGSWQIYGILSVFNSLNQLWILGLAIGMFTYLTYRSLFKEQQHDASNS